MPHNHNNYKSVVVTVYSTQYNFEVEVHDQGLNFQVNQ